MTPRLASSARAQAMSYGQHRPVLYTPIRPSGTVTLQGYMMHAQGSSGLDSIFDRERQYMHNL